LTKITALTKGKVFLSLNIEINSRNPRVARTDNVGKNNAADKSPNHLDKTKLNNQPEISSISNFLVGPLLDLIEIHDPKIIKGKKLGKKYPCSPTA